MNHLKYIFFDLDGTLVDSSKGIQESFEYSFKQLGKECPEESIIKSFMGPPLEVSFASVLEESQVPEAINYYRSFYKEKGIWGVRLYEGIPELLKQLKEAGVDGVNISLDTLDPEEFYKITGKRELQEVLAGIRAAKTAGLPVKLNAVNRKELDPIPLVRYAQEENLPLRFIEMMPVGYGKKYVGRSNEELRETLEAVCGKAECMTNREELSRMGSGPAVYYQFSDLKVPVGFISAIHGKFCDTCNRVRLTAEGYLKLCLCYDEGEDLRRVLREGEKENLRTIMEQTIFRKPAAHCFEHPAEMTETHEMVKIGG